VPTALCLDPSTDILDEVEKGAFLLPGYYSTGSVPVTPGLEIFGTSGEPHRIHESIIASVPSGHIEWPVITRSPSLTKQANTWTHGSISLGLSSWLVLSLRPLVPNFTKRYLSLICDALNVDSSGKYHAIQFVSACCRPTKHVCAMQSAGDFRISCRCESCLIG
jgi:hypothetical protein